MTKKMIRKEETSACERRRSGQTGLQWRELELQTSTGMFFCNSDPLHLFCCFFAIPNHSIYFFFILQFRPTPFFFYFFAIQTHSIFFAIPTHSIFFLFYGSSPSVFSAALVLSETGMVLQIIDVHSKHCQLHNEA